jgi:hypothetical protein
MVADAIVFQSVTTFCPITRAVVGNTAAINSKHRILNFIVFLLNKFRVCGRNQQIKDALPPATPSREVDFATALVKVK